MRHLVNAMRMMRRPAKLNCTALFLSSARIQVQAFCSAFVGPSSSRRLHQVTQCDEWSRKCSASQYDSDSYQFVPWVKQVQHGLLMAVLPLDGLCVFARVLSPEVFRSKSRIGFATEADSPVSTYTSWRLWKQLDSLISCEQWKAFLSIQRWSPKCTSSAVISVSALELLRLETDKTKTSARASQGPKQNWSRIVLLLCCCFSHFSQQFLSHVNVPRQQIPVPIWLPTKPCFV